MKSFYSVTFAFLPLISSVFGAPGSGAEIAARTPGNVSVITTIIFRTDH